MTADDLKDTESRVLDAFRRRREELGWSREELAANLQSEYGIAMSGPTYAKVEYGSRKLRVQELLAIAELLSVSLDAYRPRSSASPQDAVVVVAEQEHGEALADARQAAYEAAATKDYVNVTKGIRAALSAPDDGVEVTLSRRKLESFLDHATTERKYPLDDWLASLGVQHPALTLANSIKGDEASTLRLSEDLVRSLANAIEAAIKGLALSE